MALYSPDTYDSFHPKYTREQRINGGKKRAQTAKRHPYGLFLPDDKLLSLPDDYVHGRAGGLARAKKLREQKAQD